MNGFPKLALLAVIAATPASIATAQSAAFGDMTLELNVSKQLENDYDNIEFGASMSGNFSGDIGYQVDVYRLEYSYYPAEDIYGATLHLTYDVSAELAVGVIAGYENWEGTEYTLAGLEAQYDMDLISPI